nr:unnamed protein product [Callosobruchus chinensis]
MKVRHCQECTNRMCSSTELPSNILIKARQYDNCTMGKPSYLFTVLFKNCVKNLLIEEQLREHLFVSTEEILALFCEAHTSNNLDIFLNVTLQLYC